MDVSRFPKVQEYLALILRGQREPCATRRAEVGVLLDVKLQTLSTYEKDLLLDIIEADLMLQATGS